MLTIIKNSERERTMMIMRVDTFFIYLACAVLLILFYVVKNAIKRWCENPVYLPKEIDSFEKHLEQNFGPVKSVFHQVVPNEMHVDIYVIEPTEKNPCYRLFTCGMGAKKMEIPLEFNGKRPDRIELMLSLPADWKLDIESLENANFYWPVGLMEYLAQFPWREATWLGFGHTIPLQKFAENTELSGVLLNYPENYPYTAGHIDLPRGTVQFLNIVPLYNEEMDYKLASGLESLEKLMGESLYAPIDPKRKNYSSCCE